jgi:hypothetical protein
VIRTDLLPTNCSSSTDEEGIQPVTRGLSCVNAQPLGRRLHEIQLFDVMVTRSD